MKNSSMTMNMYGVSNMTHFLEMVDRCSEPVFMLLGGETYNVREDSMLRRLLMQLSSGGEYKAALTLTFDRKDACSVMGFLA